MNTIQICRSMALWVTEDRNAIEYITNSLFQLATDESFTWHTRVNLTIELVRRNQDITQIIPGIQKVFNGFKHKIIIPIFDHYLAKKYMGLAEQYQIEISRIIEIFSKCEVCGCIDNLMADEDSDTGILKGCLCISCSIMVEHIKNSQIETAQLSNYINKEAN